MFKEVITHMSLGDLSTAGLLLFFLVFVAVTFFALTRPPAQADQWARIPLTVERDRDDQNPESDLAEQHR
jgi:cbb3-type cytochrome oxidase subunit 3